MPGRIQRGRPSRSGDTAGRGQRSRGGSGSSGGAGTIVAIVAFVAVVGLGLVYMMSGSSPPPARTSGQPGRRTTREPATPQVRSPPAQHPEASNPVLQELTGLNAAQISQAMDTAAERQKRQRLLRRIVRDLGLSGVDLAATPEQELRRRLAAANYQAELIEVVMAARQEQVRARVLRGGRGAATYGSGFSSQRPAEAPKAPAETQPVEPAKPDTSYGAYRKKRRERGMPVSDGAPTEGEYAAYLKWREPQEAARPSAPEPAEPVASEEARTADTILENEGLAIAALRAYAQAQEKFHERHRYGAGDEMYANPLKGRGFPDLRSVRGRAINLIDEEFAAATSPENGWNGYYFVDITRFTDGRPHKWTSTFGLCAVPAEYGRTGKRTFTIDWGGAMFAKDTGGKPVSRFPRSSEGWRAP